MCDSKWIQNFVIFLCEYCILISIDQCGRMSYVLILPTGLSMELQYEVQQSKKHDGISPLSPLVDNSAVL